MSRFKLFRFIVYVLYTCVLGNILLYIAVSTVYTNTQLPNKQTVRGNNELRIPVVIEALQSSGYHILVYANTKYVRTKLFISCLEININISTQSNIYVIEIRINISKRYIHLNPV